MEAVVETHPWSLLPLFHLMSRLCVMIGEQFVRAVSRSGSVLRDCDSHRLGPRLWLFVLPLPRHYRYGGSGW